jgi:anion-transporting  ArsA/GET3 family ATPase
VPAPSSRSRRSRPARGAEGGPQDGATAFPDVRLHVVTGKGGTGKTTVAAALALALATHGRRILLVEVEDRQGLAQLFDVPPLGYDERSLAVGPWGGEVLGLAVEPRAALMEYLATFYKLGRAGRVLEKAGAIDFATTIAPGLRDVLLTGKVYEATRRTRREGGHVFDAVVLDAPPTGRITRFLNVNSEVSGLARVGPIRNQAEAVMGMLRSPTTAVHLVTLLEEMPVQETLDGVAELAAADLPVGAVLINQVRQEALPPDALDDAGHRSLDTASVAAVLERVGVAKDARRAGVVAEGLAEEGAEHAQRVRLQRRERATLDAAGRPVVELDLVPTGIDLGGLYALAERLREQGLS